MKKKLLVFIFLLENTFSSFAHVYVTVPPSEKIQTDSVSTRSSFCRYVPERKGDFSWENDKIGFRVYSKEVQKKPNAIVSGFDCWLKRVPYLVLDKWYAMNQQGKTYHRDYGEGCDCYGVGESRGCGGSALFIDGQYVTSPYYERYEIIENGPNKCVFKLYYAPIVVGNDSVVEIKTITMEKGNFYFKCEDEFISKRKFSVLAVGIAQHGGKGVVNSSQNGWISYWEPMQDSKMGSAVWCTKKDFLDKNVELDSTDKNANLWLHIKLRKNKVTYYAGFTWLKAGYHSSNELWLNYVKEISETL